VSLRRGWGAFQWLFGRLRGRCRGVAAFLFLRTKPSRAQTLGGLLDQVRRSALRARLRDRLVPRSEFALRIAIASLENLAAPAPPLENLALLAIGTSHARLDRVGFEPLDAVAVRIA